ENNLALLPCNINCFDADNVHPRDIAYTAWYTRLTGNIKSSFNLKGEFTSLTRAAPLPWPYGSIPPHSPDVCHY
ncbi:MAG: hypothetical protein V2J65_00160, partial [Desulfobacteraceae bacterium]|nr:hypothetical protein [Desulfobacteraceae bacterium]